jgi:DNA-binding transcriptional LysR family regulator
MPPSSSQASVSFPGTCLKLRFRHLQFLDILGRTRNLRVTAEQMHMTQPAATKILIDIESMFDARLFDRLPRDMRPTDLGQFVLRYAGVTLAELNKFVSEFRTLKSGGHGHLTVGAISASAAQLLTATIREIRQRRPLLVVKIVEQSSDQLAVWLEEKKLDIMVGRLTEKRHHALFNFIPLSAEAVWVVAAPDHPLLQREQVELAELGAWPWILYPPATAIRQLFEQSFTDAGLATPASMVETPSIFSTLELVQATDMLSLQPRAAVEKYVVKSLLGRVPVFIPNTMSNYGVITRKDEVLSQPMDEFITILRSVAERLGEDTLSI